MSESPARSSGSRIAGGTFGITCRTIALVDDEGPPLHPPIGLFIRRILDPYPAGSRFGDESQPRRRRARCATGLSHSPEGLRPAGDRKGDDPITPADVLARALCRDRNRRLHAGRHHRIGDISIGWRHLDLVRSRTPRRPVISPRAEERPLATDPDAHRSHDEAAERKRDRGRTIRSRARRCCRASVPGWNPRAASAESAGR